MFAKNILYPKQEAAVSIAIGYNLFCTINSYACMSLSLVGDILLFQSSTLKSDWSKPFTETVNNDNSFSSENNLSQAFGLKFRLYGQILRAKSQIPKQRQIYSDIFINKYLLYLPKASPFYKEKGALASLCWVDTLIHKSVYVM